MYASFKPLSSLGYRVSSGQTSPCFTSNSPVFLKMIKSVLFPDVGGAPILTCVSKESTFSPKTIASPGFTKKVSPELKVSSKNKSKLGSSILSSWRSSSLNLYSSNNTASK